jgi:hypothetical protein
MSLTDHLEKNGRVAEIAGAMESFVATGNLEKILHKFDQFVTGPQALLAINAHSFLRFVESSPYKAEAKRILDGLGIESEEVVEAGHVQHRLKPIDTEIYRARKQGLSGSLCEKEIVFEHVMVCQYLRSMMPVTEPGVWDSFRFFNVCYALLKGSVIGNFREAPGEAELADAIVVFHRMFAHNESAAHQAFELLNAGGLNDLAGMVALARG